jgi:hypothetical protein
MSPDIEEARALAARVQQEGDLWTPFDQGRYAYHSNIPLTDNPWNEPPNNLNHYALIDWARGWAYEANRLK